MNNAAYQQEHFQSNGHLPRGYLNLKRKPGFRRKVIEVMADGQWYTTAQVLATLRQTFPEATYNTAQNAVGRLLRDPPKGHELVSRKIGNRCQYRLRESAASSRQVGAKHVTDFLEGLLPLLRQLEDWGDKGQYEIVPSSIKGIAVQMKRLFESLKQTLRA
jgi:hypothetical protein